MSCSKCSILDALSKYGVLKTWMPGVITANLNPALALRDYQKEALFRFISYVTDYQERVRPTQLLFHMATGSGKTLIMAAAILYLYQIVLISDEAHHINALTKRASERNKSEAENVNTWEATVSRIFRANPENLLLEFTATVELGHPAIAEKYRDKILYQYSLKEFREDGFSKEVKTLQADLPPLDRALQAVVVSQYRRKVAENNRLLLKPVVLMKSRYIYESEELKEAFCQAVEGLTTARLQAIKAATSSPVIQRAFAYFEEQSVSLENLAQEIRVEFGPEKCLSVNSKSESEEKQLLVNSLEDPDNEIRVVFAVDKLNEGWDVLNLFDIVRLYNTRDAKGGRPGKTTIAEAQLIGRGARYFPFQLTPEQPRHERKYDEDLDDELRVKEQP